MKKRQQKRWGPSVVFLGGLLVLGVAGVLWYSAGLIPAGLAAAAADDPKDGGLASALAMGAVCFAIVGACLLWSATRDWRLAQKRRATK